MSVPTYEQFVENKARQAANFLDGKEWASLVRHRRQLTKANREHLHASLECLIREAEKMIEKLAVPARVPPRIGSKPLQLPNCAGVPS